MAVLSFTRATVEVFQGINRGAPLVIVFPKQKATSQKRKIGYVTGDFGKGKTSLINFLLYATGQAFDFKLGNLVNNETGQMRGELEFSDNGQPWKVRVTKSKFELLRLFRAGNEQGWIPQANPDEVLKRLIGNVAVSPMKLKTDKGDKQVDWLFKMLNVPEEVLNKGRDLTQKYNEIRTARARANEEFEYLKKTLTADPLYINWEASERKYAEVKTLQTERVKLDQAEEKRARLKAGRDFLVKVGGDIASKNQVIADLENKLNQAKAELAEFQRNQKLSEAYVAKHKGDDAAYDAAHKAFIEISNYLAQQGQWKRVMQQKKDMDEAETLVQRADTTKATLVKERRNLYNSVLPPIKGLEIVTEDTIDGEKAGVYLNGKTPIQLSESELFDLYFQLCKFLGIRLALVENIGNFGSNVYDTLNAMARNGVTIWATQTVRGQEELKIEFIDQLT